jgi:hypothetical protein
LKHLIELLTTFYRYALHSHYCIQSHSSQIHWYRLPTADFTLLLGSPNHLRASAYDIPQQIVLLVRQNQSNIWEYNRADNFLAEKIKDNDPSECGSLRFEIVK